MKYVFVKQFDNEKIKAAFEELIKIQKEHQDTLGHDEFVAFEKAHVWFIKDFELWKKNPHDMFETMESIYNAATSKSNHYGVHISWLTAYVYEQENCGMVFFAPTKSDHNVVLKEIEKACIAVANDMCLQKIKERFDKIVKD